MPFLSWLPLQKGLRPTTCTYIHRRYSCFQNVLGVARPTTLMVGEISREMLDGIATTTIICVTMRNNTIHRPNDYLYLIYLGGAVSSDGRSETEVRRRVQAGANAWRQVEGVMSDRHISKKLKGKVLGECVTLETLPVSEKHQHRLQVCENNWVRRIAGVKRWDRRRMDELREEVGIQKCLMGRLVKSRLKWTGHEERMKEVRLPRMAYVYQEREREREEDHV